MEGDGERLREWGTGYNAGEMYTNFRETRS